MAAANSSWNTAHLHHKDILGVAAKEAKNAAPQLSLLNRFQAY